MLLCCSHSHNNIFVAVQAPAHVISLSPTTVGPTISSLTYQEESRTLTCVSTGSPATTVSWMRDGQSLINSSTYHLTQTITDRSSSTYSNVLTVSETAPSGVAGTYTCNVTNDLGSDSMQVVAVGKCEECVFILTEATYNYMYMYLKTGITISGLEQPLSVGQSATISCMTNVPVSSIEWRDQSSTVLARTTDQTVVNYTIPLVRDVLQGWQLTCRAVAGTTVYTEMVTIQVTGKYILCRIHSYTLYILHACSSSWLS